MCDVVDIRKGIGVSGRVGGDGDGESNKHKIVNPILGRAESLRCKNRGQGISDPAKDAARTGSTKRGIVVDVKKVIPVDDEVWLLGGKDWAASEGGIDVKGGSLSIRRGIHKDAPDFVESAPVTPELINIDLIVNG